MYIGCIYRLVSNDQKAAADQTARHIGVKGEALPVKYDGVLGEHDSDSNHP